MAGLEGHPKPGNELTDSTRYISVFQGGVADHPVFELFFDLDHPVRSTGNPPYFLAFQAKSLKNIIIQNQLREARMIIIRPHTKLTYPIDFINIIYFSGLSQNLKN